MYSTRGSEKLTNGWEQPLLERDSLSNLRVLLHDRQLQRAHSLRDRLCRPFEREGKKRAMGGEMGGL